MIHTFFISLHAAAGLVAFVAGCLAVTRRSWFPVYFWSLVGLVLFLVVALAADFAELDALARIIFVALLGLAAVMIWSAVQAQRILRGHAGRPTARYLDHLGFTLVALFVGFVVIAMLDLGAPGWLAAAIGALGAVAGHLALRRLKAGLAAASTDRAS